MELMAIGYILLHHVGCFDKGGKATKEERTLSACAQDFFDRLLFQIQADGEQVPGNALPSSFQYTDESK